MRGRPRVLFDELAERIRDRRARGATYATLSREFQLSEGSIATALRARPGALPSRGGKDPNMSTHTLDDKTSYPELGDRTPAEAFAIVAAALRREARAAQRAGNRVLAVRRLLRAEALEEALERGEVAS